MHFGKSLDFIANEFNALAGTGDKEDIVFDSGLVFTVNLVDIIRYDSVLVAVCRTIEQDMWDFVISVKVVEFSDDALFWRRI
jgi:hypothetical protein